MEIRQSVFGEIANRSGNHISGIDFGILLRRLLLFDRVIVKSVGLQEIPFLVRTFGISGLQQLLNSQVLKLSCEFLFVITAMARDGIPSVPPCHFTFGMGELAEREKNLGRGLILLQGIAGLKNADRLSLEEAIIKDLVRPHSDYGPQPQAQIELDLRKSSPAIRASLEKQLELEVGAVPKPFEVRVDEPEPRVFHVITDLPKVYGFSEQKTHEVLEKSVGAVANLNQRIADMAAYSSISAFAESEASLLFGKFAGIVGPQNPEPMEREFARVISIAHLPDSTLGKRVDVEKLLLARESKECAEFRAWLTKLDGATDAQITEMIGGLKNKIGTLMKSNSGKILRLAVTSAIGAIPGFGVAAGPVAGALDSFLVDKLFPTSGVVAFLSNTYPSLFDHP